MSKGNGYGRVMKTASDQAFLGMLRRLQHFINEKEGRIL
jgi:hypothetical protein